MTPKFVIILQNLIKAYHRKSGKSKYDSKLTELDVDTTRIRSRVNGVYTLTVQINPYSNTSASSSLVFKMGWIILVCWMTIDLKWQKVSGFEDGMEL